MVWNSLKIPICDAALGKSPLLFCNGLPERHYPCFSVLPVYCTRQYLDTSTGFEVWE